MRSAASSRNRPGPPYSRIRYRTLGRFVDSRTMRGRTRKFRWINASSKLGGSVAVSQTVCVRIWRTYEPKFLMLLRYLAVTVRWHSSTTMRSSR